MCIDVRKTCQCGANHVQLHLRDNVMLPEVVAKVFCPACPGDAPFDDASMLQDKDWTIEYDMTLAKFLAIQKLSLPASEVSPAFIFDQGYACWLEMYPGEKEEIREEKEAILRLQKEEPARYLQTITSWNIERVQRLKAAGWRKALRA